MIEMKIACCIVAAGKGTRLGADWADTPKAMIPLLGRPMLYYSVHAFDRVKNLDRIVTAVPSDYFGGFQKLIKAWGFSHKIELVEGGERRTDSVANTLAPLSENPPDFVLIHDAARACITTEMIESMISSSDGNASVLASPAIDTLREISDGFISGEIDRSKIFCLETPQMFPYEKLVEMHVSRSMEDFSDDTTLFTRAGEKVRVAIHEGCNMKITFPEDIGAAEGILFGRGWQDATEGEE